jgi:hypothetical protein
MTSAEGVLVGMSMTLSLRAAALSALGVAVFVAASGTIGSVSAQVGSPNRIIVHVAGPQAGTVDIDVEHSLLPELLTNVDTGEVIMPTNYCGLRITQVGALHWDDGFGNLVEAENHGEVTYESGEGYVFMGENVTDAYLGGMEFTGALDTCDSNEPWYFPTPLSYGGNAPQFGAVRLILELDQPPGFYPTIEFLDYAMEPVELPDLYEDWEEPPNLEDYCEQIPEFCEPKKVDPDLVPPDIGFQLPWIPRSCWTLGTCDTGASIPLPIEAFVAPSFGPETGPNIGSQNRQIAR